MAVKVVLNRSGVRALLRGVEVQAELKRRADRIAAAAGEGHIVDPHLGPNRARVAIVTDTFEAMRSEATDRTLTRALDAGR